MSTANTALGKVMNGEKISDGQAKGALEVAVGELKSFGGKISKAREMSETIADAVIATAETGTVFAASFAEGYFGEEKMGLGPVDMRLGGGLILGGYGLYKSMSGQGGAHALALGNDLLATGIGRIGRHAGKALADKKAGGTPPAQTPDAAPAAAPAPAPAQLKGDDIGRHRPNGPHDPRHRRRGRRRPPSSA
jgi:hypothetical protein